MLNDDDEIIKKFENIEYLNNKESNDIQKRSYKILKDYNIMEILKDFQPILAGTIPIEIDIEGSDLDICCYWNDNDNDSNNNKNKLINIIKENFSNFNGFKLKYNESNTTTIFSEFSIENTQFEIFCQQIPSKEQNAFRHMIIEYKILLENDENFKKEIINLKRSGLKTEPAFAKLLNLNGNPYDELLKYYK